MMRSTKNIIRGIGSIVDIMPSTKSADYSRFVPKGTPEQRMRQTWQNVGDSIDRAMGRVSNEYKAKKSTK
jgi:hypothetical protein